jgi:hypothetical protein
MTKDDKLLLLHFMTRTGMYVYPVDLSNIASFLCGYDAGRKNECNFLQSLKDLLQKKYKIEYLSDGWAGQIKRLAEQESLSQIIILKRVALDIIASELLGGLDSEMQTILRTRIIDLINKIENIENPWYNETWTEGWLSLNSLNCSWFKALWSKDELQIIKSINSEVLNDNVFKSKKSKLPSIEMLSLKYKFDSLLK